MSCPIIACTGDRERTAHDSRSVLKEASMSQRLEYEKLSAAGVRALGGVHVYIQNSGLPKALVDLVYLRASQINGCAYCIDLHARDLMKGGVPVDKVMLVSVWRDAGDTFTAKEKAALEWTEAVTLVSQAHVPDEAFAAASAQLQPKEISDLTLAVGLINAYNRLSIGFRRLPDPKAAA